MFLKLRDSAPFVVRLFVCAGSQSVTFPVFLRFYAINFSFLHSGVHFVSSREDPPDESMARAKSQPLRAQFHHHHWQCLREKAGQLLKDALYGLLCSLNYWKMHFTVCYFQSIIEGYPLRFATFSQAIIEGCPLRFATFSQSLKDAVYGLLLSVNSWRMPFTARYI